MDTLLVAVLSFVGFIVAYRTYGRWLGQRIFGLDNTHATPSHQLEDGVDYVPTRRSIVFGHHFTSIAGTGPIVGPAIAVFWGWLPALLWVLVGSIFIGAVHDFGALVVSLRNRGQSIGEIAGRVINPRARILLLVVLLLELTIVLAVFGLVIAVIFHMYHGGVLAVWISLPIAIVIGLWARKGGRHLLIPSFLAVAIIYVTIWLGISYVPVNIMNLLGLEGTTNPYINAIVVWTVILFIYCFFASVLPVWLLLQPRDFVNSLQLFVAMGAVIVGIVIAGSTGAAQLFESAPAIAKEVPADAPPILPFLFIMVACGAVSGFHSLVSSGTSSKQLNVETDARAVGYGSMVTEGALAVIVILACCAGVGMGVYKQTKDDRGVTEYVQVNDATGQPVTGRAAWRSMYDAKIHIKIDPQTGKPISTGGWANHSLGLKLRAFIEGGANFLTAAGIPLHFAIDILGVMVACFAATTLDSATRLQRYVIQELGETIHVPPLKNKYVATSVAVLGGASLAIFAGSKPGQGGMLLWPLFGATNQVLAGLGFLVVAFYLIRRRRPIWFLVLPAILMLVLPAWAMNWNLFNSETGWWKDKKWLLVSFGIAMQILTAWLVLEAALSYRKAKRESAPEAN